MLEPDGGEETCSERGWSPWPDLVQSASSGCDQGLGPFGARGIGEPPIGPPIAVIPAAIADAVGARPTTLPVTPERVLEAIERGR